MNSYTREQRNAVITPTLTSGLIWLAETQQPLTALIPPHGINLPAVANRRFAFVPDVAGQGAALVVQVTTVQRLDGPGAPREVLTGEELHDIAAAVTGAYPNVAAKIMSAPGGTSGHIQLSVKVHPTLLAALARYRAGCPRHRHPSCGYLRSTHCSWFSDGFARLLKPTAPPPASPRRRQTVVAAPRGHRQSAKNLAGIGAANQRRRDTGAARATALAVEAIATLARQPHRRASTEEALRVLKLRVEHPNLSLRELAAVHDPPLTKDSYAARLRRALVAAERGRNARTLGVQHTNAA